MRVVRGRYRDGLYPFWPRFMFSAISCQLMTRRDAERSPRAFLGAGRAQSEVIGVVLVLGLVLAGTVAVVTLGSMAITDTQTQSELRSAEQAMTVFDSQAATVALGQTDQRSVSFGASGEYDVEPTNGRLVIEHHGWDGPGSTEVVYDEPLGAVVYRNQGTRIAYQGGGVWRQGPNGGTRMISPPEFHYRDGTLTLPALRTVGGGGAAGTASAQITENVRASPVYPNDTSPADDPAQYDASQDYANPIENGQVMVKVQSPYYEAWADYFRSRTEGTVDEYASNRTAAVSLVTLGTVGQFPMPGEGSSVEVRGIATHTLSDFEIELRPDDTDSADFSNLQWSLYADEGSQQFELNLRGGGSGCGMGIDATVYYSDDGGDNYHGWHRDDAFTASCSDLDGDGNDEIRLQANLVSSSVSLENQGISNADVTHFNPNGNQVSPVVFDEHGVDDGTYTSGATLTMETLMNHYFGLLGPSFDLTVDDKSSDTVSESASEGYIQYTGNGNFVTYLQVTENEIEVRFG
jgi:hypothetical protein